MAKGAQSPSSAQLGLGDLSSQLSIDSSLASPLSASTGGMTALQKIQDVAGGVNALASAGFGIYNALRPPKTGSSGGILGGSSPGGLSSSGGVSLGNVAGNLQMPSMGGGQAARVAAGVDYPQDLSKHYATLLQILNAYRT